MALGLINGLALNNTLLWLQLVVGSCLLVVMVPAVCCPSFHEACPADSQLVEFRCLILCLSAPQIGIELQCNAVEKNLFVSFLWEC